MYVRVKTQARKLLKSCKKRLRQGTDVGKNTNVSCNILKWKNFGTVDKLLMSAKPNWIVRDEEPWSEK